ncbi:hypothetical protein BJY52DRAFT_1184549 [Lactarius psammicola]|nr:hypothetical protein BJY52DRAFT_1184549 [Lactarius psammicola]
MALLANKHTSAAQEVISTKSLPTMYALGDAPSPSIARRVSSLDPDPHLRPRAFGIGLDTSSSTNWLSIPSVSPNHSCAPYRAKNPGMRASGLPVDTVDKENVPPVPQGADVHPIEVQQLFTPPLPTPSSPAHPHDLGSIIPPGLPPIQTLLDMTLCGQRITFDLDCLDVDPRSIIELLRTTSSDRDKWMIVGAFYRRKGNTHAALTVVATMVKVLSDLGLKAWELRPAFLMLSSCHTELWRRTRAQDGSETEVSVAHLDKSRRWLQLVYGRLTTEPRSEDSPDMLVNGTSRHAHAVPPEKEDITPENIQRADNGRDLRVLRDPRVLYVEDPASTRYAKRRLEDEASFERATRRRLERTLHDLEAKVVEAQKRVDDAHASIRAEANTRRKCEHAISEERAMEECLKRGSRTVTHAPCVSPDHGGSRTPMTTSPALAVFVDEKPNAM